MIIGQTLNGAIRTTYLRVTPPINAAFRALYHGARDAPRFIPATGRLGAEISAYVSFNMLATSRGIRRVAQLVSSPIAARAQVLKGVDKQVTAALVGKGPEPRHPGPDDRYGPGELALAGG